MSKALTTWRGMRTARLDRLAAAHVAVRSAGTGVHSEYLNWSLLLAVGSEFQGFARDLHELAVDAFVACATPDNERLAAMIRARLAGRRLAGERPGCAGRGHGQGGRGAPRGPVRDGSALVGAGSTP